jgi:hypothetical protein
MVELSVKCELEGMWEEVVMAESEIIAGHFLAKVVATTKYPPSSKSLNVIRI